MTIPVKKEAMKIVLQFEAVVVETAIPASAQFSILARVLSGTAVVEKGLHNE